MQPHAVAVDSVILFDGAQAQGMTLDAVVFNMQGLFAEGQLYTA